MFCLPIRSYVWYLHEFSNYFAVSIFVSFALLKSDANDLFLFLNEYFSFTIVRPRKCLWKDIHIDRSKCTASGWMNHIGMTAIYEQIHKTKQLVYRNRQRDRCDPLMKSTWLVNSACQVDFIGEHNRLLITLKQSLVAATECATFFSEYAEKWKQEKRSNKQLFVAIKTKKKTKIFDKNIVDVVHWNWIRPTHHTFIAEQINILFLSLPSWLAAMCLIQRTLCWNFEVNLWMWISKISAI